MISFEDLVAKHGGVLRRFKDFALNITLPITIKESNLKKIITAGREKYGKDNLLINKQKLEKENKIEISLFRKDTLVAAGNIIANPFGLEAEIFDAFSVGVGGDIRTYTPIMNVRGVFPGHDALAKISEEITSTLPINRVTFEPKL